jgi:quercetin dioxygenase-like cupin family protein
LILLEALKISFEGRGAMLVRNVKDVPRIPVKEFQSQGKTLPVSGTSVRWMVHNEYGGPEYKHHFALRHFTMEPRGKIPFHTHEYVEAVFVLKGELFFTSETESLQVGPGDVVYTYSGEGHGLENPSGTEEATFTCTIDCPGDGRGCFEPKQP